MSMISRTARIGQHDSPTRPIALAQADAASDIPLPGLLLVFSAGEPALRPIPVGESDLELGRATARLGCFEDPTISRRHASVSRTRGGRWLVRDLGSRNGVVVDQLRLLGPAELDRPQVLTVGESIFLFCDDLRPFVGQRVEVTRDHVVGPTLRRALNQVVVAARIGDTLHIRGESGSGKELAARTFHDSSPQAAGPFIAVNCAAIPQGVAERLLFGARKGAFSGAVEHAEGYAQAADGGTLFLDEVSEIDLQVQAKILRMVELREVVALGESRHRKLDIRVCTATHRDLRHQVEQRQFRNDLYYRLGRPEVVLPPLRERPEEIPWLVCRELQAVAPELSVRAAFLAACITRAWPGNVRELLVAVREAARSAVASDLDRLEERFLPRHAGEVVERVDVTPARRAGVPSRELIDEIMKKTGGRIATSARALGVHRTQLRRWLVRLQIDPQAYAGLLERASD
jgi:transcriptional regulator with AAA-type ATPase domain